MCVLSLPPSYHHHHHTGQLSNSLIDDPRAPQDGGSSYTYIIYIYTRVVYKIIYTAHTTCYYNIFCAVIIICQTLRMREKLQKNRSVPRPAAIDLTMQQSISEYIVILFICYVRILYITAWFYIRIFFFSLFSRY